MFHKLNKPVLMELKSNQMKHCYKFNTFYGDQSHETEGNT